MADESPAAQEANPEPTSFADLGVGEPLLGTLAGLGYEEPTPIQREAIPLLMAGRDLLAQAPTGTGKTAAFALPVLAHLEAGRIAGGPASAVVVVPTRELAMQVAEAFQTYGKALGARVVPMYGGQPIHQQLRGLSRGVDIVVATPGRAADHLKRGSLNLDAVRVVVLDEADEMLDLLIRLPQRTQPVVSAHGGENEGRLPEDAGGVPAPVLSRTRRGVRVLGGRC